VILDAISRHIEGHVGLMQEVVGEILLHHVALVAEADDELPTPNDAYNFMMCHRMGREPISSMGFGRVFDSSAMRVPLPPARMTHFIGRTPRGASSVLDTSRAVFQ
jgi:hypothetical protein